MEKNTIVSSSSSPSMHFANDSSRCISVSPTACGVTLLSPSTQMKNFSGIENPIEAPTEISSTNLQNGNVFLNQQGLLFIPGVVYIPK